MSEVKRSPFAFEKVRWLIYVLLLLASVQCSRSIFFVNDSYLDLDRYSDGTERLPYQGRVAMMPLLRWAKTNTYLTRASARIDATLKKTPQHVARFEPMTAQKLICVVVGVIAVAAMTFGAVWFGRRYAPELWWLGGALTLLILYVSYGARAELNLWYPYDLPHFAVFGAACLCILEGAWLPALLLFLIDIPIRETSIYLVLLAAGVALERGEKRIILLAGAAFLLFWLPARLWIVHHFTGNVSETGVRWISMFHAIADPLHWPQVASAGGYLLIPLWLGRKSLRSDYRAFLLASLPCIAVTLLFGMWYESRIFGEWTVGFAVLLMLECNVRLKEFGSVNETRPVPA